MLLIYQILILITRIEKITNLSNTNSKYAEIDSFLLEKIALLRSKNITVSQQTIYDLAEQFYKEKDNTDFKVTNYFVNTFVKRNSLSYITLHGESASADLSCVDVFKG
ncbi:hypothetical protein DMUE_4280 [Dictyocoela muelleri]|nr:hypothetical protein DMUE_4280 [Dictyocoela muelleri]